jgi:purine-nucleoside phosphorylase
MSTVAEAAAVHATGLRVVGLSCVANAAAGIGVEPLDHEDVLAVTRRAVEKLGRLLERVVPAWERALDGAGQPSGGGSSAASS